MQISVETLEFLARPAHWKSEDAIHDAFIGLYETHGHVDLAALRQRTGHRKIDQHRKSRRTVTLQHEPLGNESDSPESDLEKRETHDRLRHATSKLPMLYRRPIELHFFDGQCPDQIAVNLGRSRNTIYSQLKRGIGLLRMQPGIQSLQGVPK